MIIAIKQPDKVVVACSLVDGFLLPSDRDYVDPENLPIKFAQDGKLLACTVANRNADILLYDTDFVEQSMTHDTIVSKVLPSMKESLKKGGRPPKDDRWSGMMVVCDDQHLYQIDNSFEVSEVSDYTVFSYHEMEIYSVLDCTENLPAEERILRSVVHAESASYRKVFPVVITDTKDKQFKVFTQQDAYDYLSKQQNERNTDSALHI